MPRGHTNLAGHGEFAFPDPETTKARIPICGGATRETVRRLPDLYISREEWVDIGLNMEWMPIVAADTVPEWYELRTNHTAGDRRFVHECGDIGCPDAGKCDRYDMLDTALEVGRQEMDDGFDGSIWVVRMTEKKVSDIMPSAEG